MQYINPIEILGLINVEEASCIDSRIIKKAKRKLFAEIELSDDGYFNYYGHPLSKGDCERAINELSNNNIKEFYLYLVSNKKLNEFLLNGNESIFYEFKQDSIFKLPEFINFLSPYFPPKFDKALLRAFKDKDVELLQSILKTSFLISKNDINEAYRSVSKLLQSRIVDLSGVKANIKNGESVFNEDNISEVIYLVIQYFPPELLNTLPIYFESQILKIANEINYLSVAIWDNFNNTQICQNLLEYVLKLNIQGLNRPTFEKNYEIAKRKNQEKIEEKINAPILKKYGDYIIQTRSKIKEIENKTLTPNLLLNWINYSVSISDINRLPRTFDEIRNQIAISLRAMSVSVWNTYSNIEVSINLVTKANNITNLRSDVKSSLRDSKEHLSDLKKKIDIANSLLQDTTSTWKQTRPIKPSKATPESSSATNLGRLWLAGIIVAIAITTIVVAMVKSNNPSTSHYSTHEVNSTNDNYTGSSSGRNMYSNNDSYNSTSAPIKEYTAPADSKYKGNQLKDGASPFDGCFGKGVYNGNATLTIKNGGSYDAIVCLYSVARGKTIRNEYVRKNSQFTMTKIAQGPYKIRVLYGNDWNPTLTNNCGTKGSFESNRHFSEFDDAEYFEDNERGYTVATITLYTVANGNASSSSINQSTFFNN